MLPKGLLKEYSASVAFFIRVLDIAAIALAGWLAYVFKFNSITLSEDYLLAILVGVFVSFITFSYMNLYSELRGKSYVAYFAHILHALIVTSVLMSGLAFMTKSGELFSRLWFGSWVGLSALLLIVYRCALLMLMRYMRANGLNERRAVIVGAGILGTKFAETVQQALWTGFNIVEMMDDHAEQKPTSIHGIPVIQTPDNISDYLHANKIDELWLALPLHAESRVKEILYSIRHETVTIRLVMDIFGMNLINHSISEVAGFPVLNISSTPMMGMNRVVKAVEDRIVAIMILLLISPLLAIIALGIKLSSKGPVLFKQARLGWDGRIINVYKFRTMYLHHEADGRVTQASQRDARVTPFGRLLRRTSLDELPQFFNVLQGKMSIVGPRPHALAHNEQYKDQIHTYMQRHRVKPGITGWAQVNGWRGETDTLEKMQKRVEFDLYYINNWSLAFDIKIILLTLFRGFISKNAY